VKSKGMSGHYVKVQVTMGMGHLKRLGEISKAAGVSRSEAVRGLINAEWARHTGKQAGSSKDDPA
jgi:metal-responsive CopG/Arc/MetJ family transcriptional regulator